MRIIKRGIAEQPDELEFHCRACGTIFIAGKDEYSIDSAVVHYITQLNAVTCRCPVCRTVVMLSGEGHKAWLRAVCEELEEAERITHQK